MLEQARRSKHDTTRHSTSRHVMLVVSWRIVTWRNKWNLSYSRLALPLLLLLNKNSEFVYDELVGWLVGWHCHWHPWASLRARFQHWPAQAVLEKYTHNKRRKAPLVVRCTLTVSSHSTRQCSLNASVNGPRYAINAADTRTSPSRLS